MPDLPLAEFRDSYVEHVDPLAVKATRSGGLDEGSVDLSILKESRQAICITDAQVDLPGPVISFVNDAYAEMFCCEPSDVVGLTPRIGQGPLTDRNVLDRLRAHLTAGESVRAQAINYRLDRTAFRLRWSIDPIRHDGVVLGFIAHMRDITVEDRLRRRLGALDVLMHRGRVASGLASDERDGPVAEALAAALTPVLAEIGSASVRIGTATAATQFQAEVLDDCTPDVSEVRLGHVGTVTLAIHPDASELVDRLAIDELGEHARWLLELGEPR